MEETDLKYLKEEVLAQYKRLHQQQAEQKMIDLQALKMDEKVQRATQTIVKAVTTTTSKESKAMVDQLLSKVDEVVELEG